MSAIARRLGTSPAQRGSVSGGNCPDVLKMTDGDYLVIGRIAPVDLPLVEALRAQGASIGVNEWAVLVPADVIEAAAHDIVKDAATP